MQTTRIADRSGSPDDEPGRARFSRRQFLAAGAGGLATLGAGMAIGDLLLPSPSSGTASPDGWVRYFKSRPDLQPPRVELTRLGAAEDVGAWFLTPNLGPKQEGSGQQGLMILDADGELLWFHLVDGSFTDLRVQSYQGKPVLTWWQGKFEKAGFGRGVGIIADTNYRTIATVRGTKELGVDLHELQLTARGTALVTAYAKATADLRSIGGPARGSVWAGVVQEIDVASGRLLFEWRSTDHIDISETYAKPGNGTLDYFHVNSIGVDPDDGHLLVSARNTWTIYKIDRATGAVQWRLGGKRSDFAMGPGTSYAWQHHARAHGGGLLSVFDDGSSPQVQPQSRGLLLSVDTAARRATLKQAFVHPAHLLANNQGSVQMLPGGGAVVGWGSEPYFSQFHGDGTLVIDGRMPNNEESYRAFRSTWDAQPLDRPALAVEGDTVGGWTAYMSWNGATRVARWEALAGHGPHDLKPVGSTARAGFETAMTIHTKGTVMAARALDAAGRPLGTSPTRQLY